MKIEFLKEDVKNNLKINAKANIESYKAKNNKWIYDLYKGEEPFIKSNIIVRDIELVIKDRSEKSLEYLENVKTLYPALKHITDSQAADERLWSGLAHNQFWDYTHNYYKYRGVFTESSVINSFFINTSRGYRNGSLRNPLSRLWWVGRLTYDENRKDPFELTNYFGANFSTKCHIMLSYNFTSNPTVMKGLLSALMRFERMGYKLGKNSRDTYYMACSFLNLLGGTYILDYFSSDEIEDRVFHYLMSLKNN